MATGPTPERRELTQRVGATRVVDPREGDLHEIQKELGMVEGFDVGLEMSGSVTALRDMIDNMCHGGKIALLGILPNDAAIDWQEIIFNSLFIKGISTVARCMRHGIK